MSLPGRLLLCICWLGGLTGRSGRSSNCCINSRCRNEQDWLDCYRCLLLLLPLLLQVLTFVSSLFGDLIESIMKRDAGIKVCLTAEHATNCCNDLCCVCKRAKLLSASSLCVLVTS